ncbi:hypothetical protein [Neobacillus terrae]|uniref:hypothetical protein n=1 Tax=Neobacillus terrae TaxID=3034837 RepID=UPI00140C3128|nr:hypothetical protein [Neobacillus terrae]NHM29095.1 hypothetical protein [Neobacillus terrae]
MLRNLVRILAGMLFGYLYIKWVPIPNPFIAADFFLTLVVDPVRFFTAALAFTAGFVINGNLIKEAIQRCILVIKRQASFKAGDLILLFIIFSLTFLYYIGPVQALVLFCFIVIYVMISIYF